MLALAVHELAVNAVEHGMLGTTEGRIEVAWTVVDAGAALPSSLTWTESGKPTSDGPSQHGFETKMLTKILPYECEAETEIIFGADGLRCTIQLSEAGSAGR